MIEYDVPDIETFHFMLCPTAFKIEEIEPCQSSYDLTGRHGKIGPSVNGLFHSMFLAYNEHHHIRIRSDDIWIAIMVQFANYMRAHHDEVRSHFVQHDGEKNLILLYQATNRNEVDYSELHDR